jgi:hypothetical protein
MIEHSVVAGDLYLAVPQLYAEVARHRSIIYIYS